MNVQRIFTTEENLSAARGTEWKAGTAGTDSGATATKAATSGVVHKICWACFYADADSLIQIKDGTTVVWEGKLDIDIQGMTYHVNFPEPLQGTAGSAVSAVIAASSADCFVSFGGFSDNSV